MSVFTPGNTNGTVWALEDKQTVKVTYSKDGKLAVDAPVAARWRTSLGQKPDNLELRVVPEADVRVDGKTVTGQVISIVPGQFGWYWGGNWALWKDSTYDSSFRDPGFPMGVRVISVEPVP